MSIIDRFFNSAIRLSDLKYSWAVRREHPVNYDAVIEEAPNVGSAPAEALAKTLASLIRKHTSRKWRYVLYRKSAAADALIKALAAMDKRKRKDFVATSGNWKALQKAVQDNNARSRKFSSLSAAQKWADRNGVAVDVYRLYAKSRAEM